VQPAFKFRNREKGSTTFLMTTGLWRLRQHPRRDDVGLRGTPGIYNDDRISWPRPARHRGASWVASQTVFLIIDQQQTQVYSFKGRLELAPETALSCAW
jgi:hypothetical protein